MDTFEASEASSNPVKALKEISKLVDEIAKANESSSNVIPMKTLRQLRDKWSEKEPVLSVTASQGLLVLVENGMIPVSAAIEMMVVAIPNLQNYAGVTSCIGTLLQWEPKEKAEDKSTSVCSYGIVKNQHPLIKLLLHYPDTWSDVYTLIQTLSCSQDNEGVSDHHLPLLRPVFEFVLCDPKSSPYLPSTCRRQLWTFILKALSNDSMREFILQCLQWMQFGDDRRAVETGCLLQELCEAALVAQDTPLCLALAPLVAAHSRKLVSLAVDPSAFLRVLCQLAQVAPECSSCVTLLLADTIAACPAMYLNATIATCENLIRMETTGSVAAYSVAFALIPWFSAPSVMTAEAVRRARKLVDLIYERPQNLCKQPTSLLCRNRWFQQLRHCDRDVHIAASVCRLAEGWRSKSDISGWLNRFQKSEPKTARKLLPFVGALLLNDVLRSDKLSNLSQPEDEPLLKALLWLVHHHPHIGQHVFLLLTHALTKEKRPMMEIGMLRALAGTAQNQDTVPFVLAMLRTITNSNLVIKHPTTTFAIDLYFRLWVLQPRCFSFLHEALQKDSKNESPKIAWQTDLTRVATIKQICLLKPEAHAQDLLPIVSAILSQYNTSAGALQAAMCLDSIAALSRSGVLDVTSACRSLAAKLSNERRPVVIVSLCNLLGLLGHLPSGEKTLETKSETVVEEAIVKLWQYVSPNAEDQIINAALRGLSQFDVSRMTLKMVPSFLRKQVTLDRDFIKTPVDAQKNPVDVYTYVPEQAWKNLIMEIGAREHCQEVLCEALASWIGAELTALPRSVFILAQNRSEPASYVHLSKGHILRAVYNFLSVEGTKAIALNALSRKLPRQLPPVNWQILEDTLSKTTDKSVRCSCLTIAAKQSTLSPSATLFLMGYMPSCNVAEDKLECEALFSELHSAGKSVPSKEIGAYVIKGLQCALACFSSEEDPEARFLKSLLEKLEVTLTKTVNEEYIRTIASIVQNFSQAINSTCPAYPTYVSCAAKLPVSNRDKLTSPTLWWDVSLEKLQLAVSIQSSVLGVEDCDMPLAVLNDCIDAAASGGHKEQDYVLDVFYDVVCELRNHESHSQWMCQLMGRIQRVTVSDAHLEAKKQVVQMLCDVLFVSTIVLAGFGVLSPTEKLVAASREERLAHFPQALACLLRNDPSWQSIGNQIINWLQYLRHSDAVTPQASQTFGQTLVALRHEDFFRTTKFWMTVLS